MTGEFRNKPIPQDWILPDEFKEHLDDVGIALLSEHAIDDVPIPLSIQFSLEVGEHFEALKVGRLTAAEVKTKIEQRIAEEQERYPDSPVWDRTRTVLVDWLFKEGYEDEAFEALWSISSPHLFAAKLMDLNESTEARRWPEIMHQVFELDETRRNQIIRAFRDRVIDNDPLADTLDIFNDYLRRTGIEDDPVEGWVESQREATPHYLWDAVVATVRNDEIWQGVPLSIRQNLTLTSMQLSDEIVSATELDREWIEDAIGYIDIFENKYPDATFLGHLRGNLSLVLLPKHESQAILLASSIRDSNLSANVALEFIKQGKEEAAIELATKNSDPHLTAELLLDAEWKIDEEAPIQRLIAITETEDYPVAKRIGCLEVICDRFTKANELDRAVHYQDRIDELREQEG